MAQKLPAAVFLKSFAFVPRIAINLILTNSRNAVLLTQRQKPPFSGRWHFPGSFLLKTETLADCLKRVAKDELGLVINPDKAYLLGVFENLTSDPRGHIVDILYGYRLIGRQPKAVGDTKAVSFFSRLPEDIGFNHGETLKKVGFR